MYSGLNLLFFLEFSTLYKISEGKERNTYDLLIYTCIYIPNGLISKKSGPRHSIRNNISTAKMFYFYKTILQFATELDRTNVEIKLLYEIN